MSSLPFLFCVYKLTAAKLVWTEWICNSKLHRANLQYNITNSLILSEESFTFKYFFGTQLINIVKIWKIVPERRGGHVCFLFDALLILALFEKTLQTIALFLDPFLISAAHLPLPLSKLKSVKVEWRGGGITSPLFLPPFCAIIRFHFGNSVSSQKRETSASAHRCQYIVQHSIQGKGLQCIQYNYRRGHTNTEPRF